MIKLFVLIGCLFVAASGKSFLFPTLKEGTYTCLACTIAVGEIKRWSDYYQIGVIDIMKTMCDVIPPEEQKWRDDCKHLVQVFGPVIMDLLEKDLSPDQTCRKIKLCEGCETCTLYDDPMETISLKERPSAILPLALFSLLSSINNGDPGPIPTQGDFDGDFFSTAFYDRGSAWRGKDCDDKNKNIYPGKKVAMEGVDPTTDYNCNGIHGTDPVSKIPYEESLCGGVSRRGMVAIGDSACAHFRVPQQLLYENITASMIEQVMPLVMLEADWPMMSTFSGYANDTSGLTPGKVESIYLKLVEKNACNHRDYQNLCVNGGSTQKLKPQMEAMTRDPNSDHPILFFIMSVGDDVCNQHTGFSHMTTPTQFHDNVISTLESLNSTYAPPNSHVVFISLVDGTRLYHYLWNRTHPLGMTYEKVYSYMICCKANPCWGWLNPNETVRNITQQKANVLSGVYQQIVKERSYPNFDLHYVDLPTVEKEIIDEWLGAGNDILDLIEPFDGFHPGQAFQALLAEKVYDLLMKEDPSIFGDVNPNNAKIKMLFGNQGGY